MDGTAPRLCPCCKHPLIGDYTWSPDMGLLLIDGRTINFTRSESRVFDALLKAHRKGQGLSRDQLTHHMYAEDIDGGALTATVVVRVVIAHIKRKLASNSLFKIRSNINSQYFILPIEADESAFRYQTAYPGKG